MLTHAVYCPPCLQTFEKKTFADKTVKFVKVFSLESLPLHDKYVVHYNIN